MIYDLQATDMQLDDLETADDEGLEHDLGDGRTNSASPKLFLS